ncbi:helix-turn-helix transcriptional regulator [Sporosarcina sp. resist]|uniref:helix-turn-helix domain-containing protein n=1 Tax=Sporosarcina sp. resist TaxID=2762563 RepID=UPI00164D7B32|nr:AraC family transcriptional regulator [Sporosarcina sp. resist]QNK90200.1 helix-turn-helix transcriptional regulator [Sporosarcina sp. resist]
MLSKLDSLQYGTFGFLFKGPHQQRIVGIHSLGWEKQTDSSYDWNGLTRTETDIIVFQYTLKGAGKIKIEDQIFHLTAGQAFFVKIPSDHQYYLPSDSSEWEFIHISLFGQEAIRCYEDITNNLGHILKLNLHSQPISRIIELLRIVSVNKMNDAYEASSFAYSFLMELYRYISNIKTDDEWPKAISSAITFISNNFQNSIILDDIVDASGLSKYHFTRLFHKSINITPIQYLTTIRINKSIELLKNDKLSIEDIALNVGFSNGNYFGKVFRASLGISPGEYRNTKSFITVDHIIGDY